MTAAALFALLAALPASECPDRAWIEARVEALTGAEVGSLEVEVRFERTRGSPAWLGRLRSQQLTAGEERLLRGESCQEVAEAVVVVIAMALGADPTAPPPAATDPTPATKSEARPPRAREAPALAEPRPGEPVGETDPTGIALGLSLGLQGLGTVGQLPGSGLGLAGYAAVEVEAALPLRVEAGAQLYLPSESVVRPNPEAGGSFVLAAGELRLCGLPWTWRPVRLGLCAGGELGLLWAEGFGITAPASAFELLFGVSTELELVWALGGPVALSLRLGALWPVVRPMFSVNPLGEVHQVGPVIGRAALGLEFEVL